MILCFFDRQMVADGIREFLGEAASSSFAFALLFCEPFLLFLFASFKLVNVDIKPFPTPSALV